MEKIVIAGPYHAEAKKKMIADLSRDYQVVCIANPEEFEQHLDANYVILRTIPLSADVIRRMPGLRMIQRWGAGVDIIAMEEANRRGIPVANIAGENAPTVAELTIGLILGVYRRIITIHNALHEGRWIKNGIDKCCYMVCDKTVGVVGLGNIGSRVAEIVSAMGATVQYYDVVRRPELEANRGYRYVTLETLLRTSDIVSLHLPLSEETHHMIGEWELSKMKDGAVLINAARGGIVDEAALIKSLKNGHLLGAGLDCYEHEPLPSDSPLLELDNVVLSCHVGGNTADLAFRLAKRCPANIRAFGRGELDPKYVVNKSEIGFAAREERAI